MNILIRPVIALTLALGLAACATTPPAPVQASIPTPHKKCVDVKMDLDTGRKC